MAFDINPLGTQMHLRQLERDVRRMHDRDRMRSASTKDTDRQAKRHKSWIQRIAGQFLAPRHAH